MDVLTLLLPVLWAITASFIGLVLYRTSAAVIESVERSTARTRRIRLVGSVAIAALAFYGMAMYTPSARLKADAPGLEARIDEIDRATLDAEGALAANDTLSCKSALLRVQHSAAQLRQQVRGGAAVIK